VRSSGCWDGDRSSIATTLLTEVFVRSIFASFFHFYRARALTGTHDVNPILIYPSKHCLVASAGIPISSRHIKDSIGIARGLSLRHLRSNAGRQAAASYAPHFPGLRGCGYGTGLVTKSETDRGPSEIWCEHVSTRNCIRP